MTDIISLIAVFAPLFSERVWSHAQLLLVGAILAPGKRTVTSVLRVMGRSEELRFTNFDWVLNRVKWSTRQGSRILLGLLVTAFVPAGHCTRHRTAQRPRHVAYAAQWQRRI